MALEKLNDDVVIAFEPEKVLRDLIGRDANLAEIFTKERIEDCQNSINDARGSFFDVANEELTKLEALVKGQDPDKPINDMTFEDIAARAADIRGHAEIFGFALIGTIGNYIVEYCQPGAHVPPARFRLIADLTKLLRIAIRQKISDDRGMLARELNASLKKL